MGGLANPGTRKRMGGTRVNGEKGEGTQQGRNGAAPGFFAFPGGRGGLQIKSLLDMQRALRLPQTSKKSGGQDKAEEESFLLVLLLE